MEYRGLLHVLVLVLAMRHVIGRESKVGMLVEGLPLTYGSQLNVTSFELDIEINFTYDIVMKLRAELEEVMEKWLSYAPFKKDKQLADNYLNLLHKGFKNLLEAHRFMLQILQYITVPSALNLSNRCNYTVTGITDYELKVLVKNLNWAYEKLGPAWTPSEIRAESSKDNAIRLFGTVLDSEMLNLYEDNVVSLSLIDSLSSGIFPQYLLGLYQAAPCVGPKLNEELKVVSCTGYTNVYTCTVEIHEPAALHTVQEMIPVHYNSIALMGESESQRFVRTQTGSRVQL